MFDDAFYYALRTIARKRTMEALNKKILVDDGASIWDGTRLASITDEAVNYAENEWPKYYGDTTHHGFVKPWSVIWSQSQLQTSTLQFGKILMEMKFFKEWLQDQRHMGKNTFALTGLKEILVPNILDSEFLYLS